MAIFREDTRAEAEFEAYELDGEFGYEFRSRLELEEETKNLVSPYGLLKDMKEDNIIYQRNVDLLLHHRKKRFVT